MSDERAAVLAAMNPTLKELTKRVGDLVEVLRELNAWLEEEKHGD